MPTAESCLLLLVGLVYIKPGLDSQTPTQQLHTHQKLICPSPATRATFVKWAGLGASRISEFSPHHTFLWPEPCLYRCPCRCCSSLYPSTSLYTSLTDSPVQLTPALSVIFQNMLYASYTLLIIGSGSTKSSVVPLKSGDAVFARAPRNEVTSGSALCAFGEKTRGSFEFGYRTNLYLHPLHTCGRWSTAAFWENCSSCHLYWPLYGSSAEYYEALAKQHIWKSLMYPFHLNNCLRLQHHLR